MQNVTRAPLEKREGTEKRWRDGGWGGGRGEMVMLQEWEIKKLIQISAFKLGLPFSQPEAI